MEYLLSGLMFTPSLVAVVFKVLLLQDFVSLDRGTSCNHGARPKSGRTGP